MIHVYSLAKYGELNVSENFKVKEFACNDKSDVIFIDSDLASLLENIRKKAGKPVTINSGYRTVYYNTKIGGATYSQHTYGKAADITIKGLTPKEVASIAETFSPGGIGIYSSFTHVDVRNTGKSRWNG